MGKKKEIGSTYFSLSLILFFTQLAFNWKGATTGTYLADYSWVSCCSGRSHSAGRTVDFPVGSFRPFAWVVLHQGSHWALTTRPRQMKRSQRHWFVAVVAVTVAVVVVAVAVVAVRLVAMLSCYR